MIRLAGKICTALPGFHAFTGCDSNPSFYGKGKNKPFKLLAENDKYQEAFTDLADPEKFHAELGHIEDFVCKMYMTKSNGLKNIKTVDEARLQLFTGKYSMIDNMECFSDACTLASILPRIAATPTAYILYCSYMEKCNVEHSLKIKFIRAWMDHCRKYRF